MKIGIIREGKTPPDSRVPLSPAQCAHIIQHFPIDLVVEHSEHRCFKNEEYEALNVPLSADLQDCDILMGVKEVPIDQLIPDKTYLFFSHTIKEQAYNKKLLQAILAKQIRLIDYEVLTDEKGRRLIAFGRFAGMVGAHNALLTYAMRTKAFEIPRMNSFIDYKAAINFYKSLELPPVKIVLTGTGRVGQGSAEVLRDMGIEQVGPEDFLNKAYDKAVFTQLRCEHYAARTDGTAFDKKDFYQNPHLYASIFAPYFRVADIMINGIYWDNQAPAFFTRKEMQAEDFKIKVIADVTCDIAPVASIPATIRPSTIADPIFGYDPHTGLETAPFQAKGVDMMAIDNLPSELPRDASESFGNQFIQHILPEFLQPQSDMLDRATIAVQGQLGSHFQYLKNYAGLER